MGQKHMGYQAKCITVRKSHGCIHQDVLLMKMLVTRQAEEGSLDQVQFY